MTGAGIVAADSPGALRSAAAAEARRGQVEAALRLQHQAVLLTVAAGGAADWAGEGAALTALEPLLARAGSGAASVLAELHRGFGSAALAVGQTAVARASLERAVALAPDDALAWGLLGNARFAGAEPDGAVEAYRRALRGRPGWGDIHVNLGVALQQRQPPDDAGAIAAFRAGAAAEPGLSKAHYCLGAALHTAGDLDGAAAALARAAVLAPGDAAIVARLGEVEMARERPAAAVAAYRTALALRPDWVDLQYNLGVAQDIEGTGDLDAAADCYRRAVALAPDCGKAHFNLGGVLFKQGRLDEAVIAYGAAMATPDQAEKARMSRANALLTRGRLSEGLADYESRKTRPAEAWEGSAVPEWTGGPVLGRRLFLVCEQGFGDSLQFVRYAAVLKAAGAWIAVGCPTPLARLLGRARGVDLAAVNGGPVPAVDQWAPLMSLPYRLGTTLDSIPAPVPYLVAEPERIQRWRAWLDAAVPPGPELRAGIAWQGNPAGLVETGRSVPLAALQPLARVPGIRLVILQKRHGLDQLAAWPPDLPLARPGPDFDDGADAFLDTAALMESLDLVITSDTAVVHLAGGLGRPTWLMLQHDAEWRWLRGRGDSPWYPTLRLYRQARPGDWDGVAARLAGDLAAAARR